MKTKNIMIVGVGGQGSLLASKLLGHLLMEQGYDVKVSEVHGMSQRGGSVVTYVRYGDKVWSSLIEQGEADLIVSFEQLESARWLAWLKPGGVLVWHVPNERGEATFSTAQFRQVVYFQSIQLRLIDTILVEKERNTPPTPVRYGDAFESMYILAKGKPKTVHILKDKPNKWAGTKTWGCLTKREVNGTLTPKGRKTIQKFGARTNVWHYGTVLPMESELFGGKAVSLSERLAEDHIRTWSNEGDLVLAPFDKDGTVAKIAPLLERRWLSLQNAADCDGLRDNAG